MAFPPQSPTPTFPYQVEARIGEGAMGIVYRALEPSLERRVAIKSLHAAGVGSTCCWSRRRRRGSCRCCR